MSAESKACHEEEEAEQVVADGMKWLDLQESELASTYGSDPKKVAIAHAMRQKTAVTDGGQWRD